MTMLVTGIPLLSSFYCCSCNSLSAAVRPLWLGVLYTDGRQSSNLDPTSSFNRPLMYTRPPVHLAHALFYLAKHFVTNLLATLPWGTNERSRTYISRRQRTQVSQPQDKNFSDDLTLHQTCCGATRCLALELHKATKEEKQHGRQRSGGESGVENLSPCSM